MLSVTCIAPVNIAVIKYWGKKDEKLIIPLNDSISATLSTDHLCARTTISTAANFTENRMILNGKEELFDNPRLLVVLDEIRKRAQRHGTVGCDVLSWKIEIKSENNFPTAAGLASSAAGYACLVFALAQLYKLPRDEEISGIARLGSGSACRSIYGGFVQWQAGTSSDTSHALQLAPASHWPEMRILILVVSEQKKTTSSTGGMTRSVKTSELLKYRVEHVVPQRVSAMISAINAKDFASFADITMRDSNQFHATCLDTFPPCKYMNDVSHSIASFVHQYNEYRGGTPKVAYTYDAGPNACLYLLEKDVDNVLAFIQHVLPNTAPLVEYFRGIQHDISYQLTEMEKVQFQPIGTGLLKFIIHTKVGEGPQVITG